jgi:hypothetical protein
MSKNPDPWPKGRFLRLGAPTGRFPDGYADDPACGTRGEPEYLDQADFDRYIAKGAKQRRAAHEAGVELELKLLSQEERIVNATAEAKAKRRDVSSELYVLRRMQDRGKSAAVIEKRLQRLERLAYLNRAA